MPNTTIELRQSSSTGNTPSLGVLANGELAINRADGILYYKTSSNTLGSIRTTQPAGLTTEIQFNDAGSFGSNAALTFSKTTGLLSSTLLKSTQSAGDEGGQLDLALAATNTTLNGSVAIDIYQNKLRIFETGGTNRGVYIDMANGAATGVGTDLLNPTVTPDTVARTTANAAFNRANSANILAQAAFDKANTDVTNISATAGVYGNATHVPIITLAANGRVSSIVNTAISGISGGNSFGQIVANGGTILATSSNDSLQIVGESGITVTSNITAKKVVVSVPAGYTFTSADYGFVYEDTNVIYDYGTL